MNGILLIILSFSPLLVKAVGSPASTHPPSNIDWNTLDTLIELPSPNVHQKSSMLTNQEGRSISQPSIQTNPIKSSPPKKKKKKRNPHTVFKAYQNQQKKYHEDKEYAAKRRLQVKLANRRYKAKKSLASIKKE